MKIQSEQLKATVDKILKEYGDEAKEDVEESIQGTAKEAAKKLKSAGDFGGKGTYKKGWTAKVEKKRAQVYAVVYNSTRYQLTHLLEYGHAKQNGGRTRAFEHIAPVNDWAQEEILEKLKEKL